jgi:hypothetical protein
VDEIVASESMPPDDSQPRAVVKQMKGVLGSLLRKTKPTDLLNSFDRPHWRKSVNLLLQEYSTSDSVGESSQHIASEPFTESVPCGLLELPKEIRHLIEEYLPQVDALCLRQTCQKLRYESKHTLLVQNLCSRQLYSLRERLDRECFWHLCAMEERKTLGPQLAVCSFCQSVHDKKSFPSVQLRLLPQEGICTATSKNHLVCGRY